MMRKFNISFLIFVLLFSFCEKAELTGPQPPDFDQKIFLTVTTKDTLGNVIDSAEVSIDSSVVGHTPFEGEVEMEAGEHHLKVNKEGYVSYETNFCVDEDDDNLDFKVFLETVEDTIDEAPDSGEVYINLNVKADVQIKKVSTDKLVVDTLVKELYTVLEKGIYHLSVSKPGYTSFEEGFQVTDSSSKVFNVSLEKLDADSLWITTNVPKKDTVGHDIGISWEATEGSSVHISPQIGDVGSKGKSVLSFSSPGEKVVTFLVEKGDRSLVHQDTIEVLSDDAELFLNFQIKEDTVEVGDYASLFWKSNAEYVNFDHGIGQKSASGNTTVSFSEAGKEVISCMAVRGGDSLIKFDTVVVVEPASELPLFSMSVNNAYVKKGESARVSWKSSKADYVSIDRVSNPSLNGSANISFDNLGKKVIVGIARNKAGVSRDSVVVEVVPGDIVFDVDTSVANKEALSVCYGVVDVDIDTAGYYRIYAEVSLETSEDNESFFIQVVHDIMKTETPTDPNLLDLYKIVVDDRDVSGFVQRDCGRFWMEKGSNLVDLYHYGQIAGNHPEFVQGYLSLDKVEVKNIIIKWVSY